MKRAVSWLAYPTLVAGGMLAVDAAIGRNVEVTGSLVALQVVTMLTITLLERWMPEHGEWNVAKNDVRTDALYFLVSGLALTGLIRFAVFSGTPSLGLWPARWPVLAQVFLAVAITDLGSYASHVVTHKSGWLFAIHAPHHSARRLYWLNASRMHPLDQGSTLILSLVPLALLGAPARALALFDAFAIVHLLLQHSNIRLRHGPLSYLLATAEFHRWHHSTKRVESECNYATFLSLWDHLFRTFRMPAGETAPVEVGLYDGMTIDDGFRAQLRSPFRAWLTPPRIEATTSVPIDAPARPRD